MSESEAFGLLSEIFRELFKRDDLALSPGTTAKDVEGWDSFRQIEIIMALEERLGVAFTSRELGSLHCLADLASQVAHKTSA
jgi:acyl carrier protein